MYELTLFIYELPVESADPYEISIQGEDVCQLKSQIDELILHVANSGHNEYVVGEVFVEMQITKDGEYFDSDELNVVINTERNAVLYVV